MTERFYRGWIPGPDDEVPREAIAGLKRYSRAVSDDAGNLRAVEMYSRGALKRVEFQGQAGDPPGVPFEVRHPAGEVGDLHWSVLQLYTAEGELRGYLVQLLDHRDRAVINAEYSPEGASLGTTKCTYQPSGGVHYVFEYDETGKLVDLYDSPEGRSPAFEPVLDRLGDRAFFGEGRSLPDGVPGDTDEILRKVTRQS